MDEQTPESLVARIERLERQMVRMQDEIAALGQNRSPFTEPTPRPVSPLVRPAPTGPSRPHTRIKLPSDPEQLLGRVGIGLLLFGLAFAFKYSIDQGWITPPVRVAFGLTTGIGLLLVGVRLRVRRNWLSQILQGGGIATLYGTIFSAFQLYGLVGYTGAFSGMAAVTILAFALAVGQDQALLSIVGALGGFGTPFLLYTGAGSLPGLIGYSSLILAGTTVVYFLRGWRVLLLTNLAGGWLVLLAALVTSDVSTSSAPGDRFWFQAGILIAWALLGIVPTLREWRAFPGPREGESTGSESVLRSIAVYAAPLSILLSPFLAFAFSQAPWRLSNTTWGLIAMGVGASYAIGTLMLASWDSSRPFRLHGIIAASFVAIGLSYLFDGPALALGYAAEALFIHYIHRHRVEPWFMAAGHLLAALAGIVLLYHLGNGAGAKPPIVNVEALLALATIGVGLTSSWLLSDHRVRLFYRIGLHILVLGWFAHGFAPLPNGQAFVTMAWGGYAVALLVGGLRLSIDGLRLTALATILLVVAKLFLVDLAEISALWRIIIFLLLGAVFLLLSYLVPSLWRPAGKTPETPTV